MQSRWPLRLIGRYVFCAISLLFLQSRYADAKCTIDAPVEQVQATGFYVGAGSHEINLQAMQRSNMQYRPVQMFVIHLSQNLDTTDHPSLNEVMCSVGLLESWASARALLTQPENSEGIRQRARFAIGINVVAIKLRALKITLSPTVIGWLKSLNSAIMIDYSKGPRKGNLYVWSGVDAASFSMLSGDSVARHYADDVWADGIAAIQNDGSVETELTRGPKALFYHQYYLSALLMLREIRSVLGVKQNSYDDARLKMLASFVTDGFCDSRRFQQIVGFAKQDIPPAYQFAVPLAFGDSFLRSKWRECVAARSDLPIIDSGFGGDMHRAKLAIETSAELNQ